MTDQIDMFSGEALRDAGIAQAMANADTHDVLWSEQAQQYLLEFLLASEGAAFLAEDVRAYAHKRGISTPPDPRAWGGVFQGARKRGLIRGAGYAMSNNPQAHKRPSTLWVSEVA